MSSEQQAERETPLPLEARVVDKTMSVERANLHAIALIPVLLMLTVLPYILLRGWAALIASLDAFTDHLLNMITLAGALIVGIVIHEALHGVGWGLFSGQGLKPVRFGFKSISPYCHYDVTMPATAYRIGTILPLILLGILPALAAAITGSVWLLIFAALMAISAGGDVLILWLLRGIPGDVFVQDHPSDVGCRILI